MSKQKRIHTTIDKVDRIYAKKHGLKIAHLIRAGVRDHRLHSGEGDVAESSREMRDAKEKAIEHRDRIVAAVNKHLSEEEALKIFKSI